MDVRDETRAALLAYGFLRGKKYRELEAHAHQEPDLKRIAELARKFGSLGISEAEGAIQAWFEAKPA